MVNSEYYRFWFSILKNSVYIVFDSNGYAKEVKGFGMLIFSNVNPDKDLVGKHVDEISKMLEKHEVSDVHTSFEIGVRKPLLEMMLEQK